MLDQALHSVGSQGCSSKILRALTSSRIRRVKCDEGKPSCTRCVGTGRTCDGYVPPVQRRSPKRWSASPSPKSLLPRQCGSFKEQRAFNYFTTCTSCRLSGSFSSDFWERHVPQICLAEPSLLHAAIAMASIHEAFAVPDSAGDGGYRNSNYIFGLSQYSIAVRELNHCITATPNRLDIILTTCALLVCFDSVRSQHHSALTHLTAAVKIIELQKRHKAKDPITCRHPFGSGIIPLFTRLGL